MKAEGLDYDARIEALEKIEYDKPLKDFIYETFNLFAQKHPWVKEHNIHPKSIARDMFVKGATFNEYISELGLQRGEGLLLRYLSQTYKTLMQSVPDQYKSDDLLDIIAYLRTMLSRIDTSLIDEWESLFEEAKESNTEPTKQEIRSPYDPRVNHKAFVAKVHSELFHLVRLLSQKNYEEAALAIANSGDDAWDKPRFIEALEDFYRDYDHIIADPRARNPSLTKITKLSDTLYTVLHTILDDKEDNLWHLDATIDLNQKVGENITLLHLDAFGS